MRYSTFWAETSPLWKLFIQTLKVSVMNTNELDISEEETGHFLQPDFNCKAHAAWYTLQGSSRVLWGFLGCWDSSEPFTMQKHSVVGFFIEPVNGFTSCFLFFFLAVSGCFLEPKRVSFPERTFSARFFVKNSIQEPQWEPKTSTDHQGGPTCRLVLRSNNF